jgi:uncharacterized protein involved in tolerance to divalent cations
MAKKKTGMLVLTTVAKKSDATRLATALVREGLAACVNVLPNVESHYTWKGKIQSEGEWILLMKTTAAAYPLLEKRLLRIHPYECPEIIGIGIDKIAKNYADWLFKNVV